MKTNINILPIVCFLFLCACKSGNASGLNRAKASRELAQKNRIGTKALDFNYTLASGAQGSLYQQKEELDEWRKHLNVFPKKWVNAYDKTFAIKDRQLYDLRAIPTLYLLNKDKTVLLKDATSQAIEEYLLLHQ